MSALYFVDVVTCTCLLRRRALFYLGPAWKFSIGYCKCVRMFSLFTARTARRLLHNCFPAVLFFVADFTGCAIFRRLPFSLCCRLFQLPFIQLPFLPLQFLPWIISGALAWLDRSSSHTRLNTCWASSFYFSSIELFDLRRYVPL